MNKKLFLAACCAGSLLFTACGGNGTSTAPFTVKNYSDSVANKVQNVDCEVQISIDYPETGNEALLNGVREWILDQTSCAPTTDINSGDSIVKGYVDAQMKDMKEIATELAEFGSAQGCSNSIEIKKTSENDKFVTFSSTSYNYMGGAHGSQFEYGTTFRKSDGKVFGYNMLNLAKKEKIAKLIEKALADDLGFETVDELKKVLFLPEFAETVPLPQSSPYLDKDTMVFVYQQYEIASYATGIPTARIPLSELKSYLSASFAKTYYAGK